MITGIDIKLEPVPMSTTGSGELFKLRLKRGIAFDIEINNYTIVTSRDINDVITTDFLANTDDKVMTITEGGNGFSDKRMVIPIRNIRYIVCYEDNVA